MAPTNPREAGPAPGAARLHHHGGARGTEGKRMSYTPNGHFPGTEVVAAAREFIRGEARDASSASVSCSTS